MALAQPPAKPLTFEVASIKPSDPNGGRAVLSLPGGESLTATNSPVRALITFAYGIPDPQLTGGPSWIGSDRYDVTAKTGASELAPLTRAPTAEEVQASDNRTRERARALLAERFGLLVHREMREQVVYLLTIAKNGPKLKEIAGPADQHSVSRGRGRNQGFAATLEMLADSLSGIVGRPVLDKTGFRGAFDWLLEWTPDSAAQPSSGDPTDNSAPSVFTALQEQLGLRLESGKAPMEVVVIDRVERPSAN